MLLSLGGGGKIFAAAGVTELLQDGFFAYQNRDYPKAEEKLSGFVTDYGKSTEASQYMEKVLRLLSLSQIQQQKFDLALANIRRYLQDYPKGDAVEEFSFWRAFIVWKEGEPGAVADFDDFLKKYPRSPKVAEAQLGKAMALCQSDKFKEAAEFLSVIVEGLPPHLYDQGQLLLVHALIQAGENGKAAGVLAGIDLSDPKIGKVGGFNLLALDLGSRLMEAEQWRPALLVLQGAWPRARVLSRQQARVQEMDVKLVKLKATSTYDKFEELQLQEGIAQIRAEMEQFDAIEDYDAALQLRIARCFYNLERYREAAMVFRGMLDKLKDSPLLAGASYQMLVCLTRMERWDEVVSAAAEFRQKFPKDPLGANVAYLAAEALMRCGDYQGAAKAFDAVAADFPKFAEAERCYFMAAYCLMMQERNKEAVEHFGEHRSRYPGGKFAEQVDYWEAMALHYDKNYPDSRKAFGEYLKRYPKGSYVADSNFRRAQALFNEKDFTGSYKELEDFLKKYGDTVQADEASNLLGDAYLAMGEIDRGIAAYRRTSKRDGRMYDYSWFRIGAAYKATEEFDKMRAHYEAFLKERKGSPRTAEALGQLAWLDRKDGRLDEARKLYWTAIKESGNDPEVPVEDLMMTLAKMYKSPEERNRLNVELEEFQGQSDGEPTLLARLSWLQAELCGRSDPGKAQALKAELPALAGDPRKLSPILLADAGDALRERGKPKESYECYHTLLAWYPRSLLKDRAYAGLGLLARTEGKPKEALAWFELFEKNTNGSPLLAQVLQTRSDLLVEKGDYDGAIAQLNRVLEVPSAKGLPWVQSLYSIGELHLKQGQPEKAIPYFQRIYIMYGRWGEYVAKSYWESGKAFEKLNRKEEAMATYRELLQNTHLKDTPEYPRARQRLEEIGG